MHVAAVYIFYSCFFQKLVNETFQNMWFTPVNEREENISAIFRTKVMNITDVVNACKDTGYEWFEHLLENVSTLTLLKVVKSCFYISKNVFKVLG